MFNKEFLKRLKKVSKTVAVINSQETNDFNINDHFSICYVTFDFIKNYFFYETSITNYDDEQYHEMREQKITDFCVPLAISKFDEIYERLEDSFANYFDDIIERLHNNLDTIQFIKILINFADKKVLSDYLNNKEQEIINNILNDDINEYINKKDKEFAEIKIIEDIEDIINYLKVNKFNNINKEVLIEDIIKSLQSKLVAHKLLQSK